MHKSIAVVGMGCIFPDAMDISEYWSNIIHGKDSIRDIPDEYWLLKDYYDSDHSKKDKTYSKRAGVIDDISFNAIEFGIMPRDLESISVEQLFALVVAKQALIDAGMYGKNSKDFDREKVGVILAAGIGKTAFSLNTRLQIPKFRKILRNSGVSEELTEKILERIANAEIDWTENSNPGYLPNVVAGRVASRFNLYGTNCTVDAACASSLAALKYAVNELECGDCDTVLTGAVNLDCSEFSFISFSKTPAISSSDRIKPFDKDADGMILGDGVGMVVLKRLEDAQRDGDRIYGVIKGIGASGDGRAKGIFAPSVDGQIRALKRAYENANVDPASISLIEAHGTGTKVGDEYELEALKKFFTNNHDNRYIGLGSVKSQIGHTRLAAGMASFIKVMLALYHKVLPSTLHVENPSEIIRNTQFNIIDKSKSWIVNDEIPIRRAGISAFGFGGTNYHVVVEEYTGEIGKQYRLNSIGREIILSGISNEEIIRKCEKLKKNLINNDEVDFDKYYGDLKLLKEEKRVGFIIENRADGIEKLSRAIELLETYNERESWYIDEIYYRRRGISSKEKIATVFSLYQNQSEYMFNDVTLNYPEMRMAFSKADNTRIKYNKKPISQIVYPFVKSGFYDENIPLAMATISCGIYEILKNRGYRSHYLVGYKIAEMVSRWDKGLVTENEIFDLIQSGNSLKNSKKEKIGYFERAIEAAYKNGARIFVVVGTNETLANEVKRVLKDESIEVIRIDSEKGENSYINLEIALMKLRIIGLDIQKDNYIRNLDCDIRDNIKKKCISINPRIFRSEEKEKLVRDAIYKNYNGEYTDKFIIKNKDNIIQENDNEKENFKEELEREIAIEEKAILEVDNRFNNNEAKLLKKDWNSLYETQKLNEEALKYFFDNQKLQLDFFGEAIERSKETGKVSKEIVKTINSYGKKNLEAYYEYVLKQNRDTILNLSENKDKEENVVVLDKKVGMRVMDVACKKIIQKPCKVQIKRGLVIATLDKDGVAVKLCKQLKDKGFKPVILNLEMIDNNINEYPVYTLNNLSEESLRKTIKIILNQNSITLTGFIYTSSKSFDKCLKVNDEFEIDKAIFLIAKYFYLYSEKDLRVDEKKFFINVVRMDGFLGFEGKSSNIVLGGLFGLGKCLGDEWSDTLVKTIDIQRECNNDKSVGYIMEEIFLGDKKYPEVGINIKGERYSLGLNEVKTRKIERNTPSSEDVFLVTGGSRGITAKCIIRLGEKYHSKFVILGRTALSNDLDLGIDFKNKRDLQKAIIDKMRQENKKFLPKEVNERVNSYYAQIKILETINRLEALGSEVLYYSCDVMNEYEVNNVVNDAVSKIGEITGFIHGAGVLADKYIHNKVEKDFSLVAGTKIFGLDMCLKSLKMDKVKFIIFFSSVAAFFGNRGQSDYAIGNEVLNKMSYRIKNMYPSCKVISINWGPWDGGMIDNSLKNSLAEREISVIPIREGIELFMEQFKYQQVENVSQVVVYDKRVF